MAMSSFAREIDAVLDAAEGKKPEELLMTYKGVLYPSVLCCAETFQALDTMEVRKDDVFLATYPKCGKSGFFWCKIERKVLRCQIYVIIF